MLSLIFTLLSPSMFLAVWVGLFVATTEHAINNAGATGTKYLSCVDRKGWIQSIALGVAVGFSNYIATEGLGWAITAFVVMTCFYIFVGAWVYHRVNRWREAILIAMAVIPAVLVFTAAGAGIAEPIVSGFWASFFITLPWIFTTTLASFALLTILCKKCLHADEGKKKGYRIAVIVTAIVVVLGLIAQVIWGGIEWVGEAQEEVISTSTPEPTPEPTPIPTPEPTPAPVVEEEEVEEVAWYYFYNTEMRADEDVSNDFNFGSYPLDDLFFDKVNRGELSLEDIAGKTQDELIALVTPEEIQGDFLKRVNEDPALGAADLAWFDAKMGTRYLGVFYDECNKEWDAAMNAAKERWMDDKESYYRSVVPWMGFLDTAESIEIIKVTGGLDDQMYMNPYTTDLIPDIIVMESPDQAGYFLRYNFSIKGKKVSVDYRIDCGYQPTNVSKLMKITPQENPNKRKVKITPTPTTTPTDKDRDKVGKRKVRNKTDDKTTSLPDYVPSNGGGGSTPVVSVPKRTDVGTDVGNSDVPGPGESTNNGVGAIYSLAEQPQNSIFDVYQEYKEEMKENNEVAEKQLVGGDPNTPTTETPADTELVDGNADKGNGFGGIDLTTTVSELITGTDIDTGAKSSVQNEVGTDTWGGPID